MPWSQPAFTCATLIETLEQNVKTSERRHWRRSGVFIFNIGHISHIVLVFPLLTFFLFNCLLRH